MNTNERKKTIDPSSLVSLEGDVLTLKAESAHPPGYRMEINLQLKNNTNPVRVSGKVISILKATSPDPSSTIAIRVHSLTRTDREMIVEHMAGSRNRTPSTSTATD